MMQWKNRKAAPTPVESGERIIKGFLLFPKTIGDTTKWLEVASWKQRYKAFTSLGYDCGIAYDIVKNHWEDVAWVSEQDAIAKTIITPDESSPLEIDIKEADLYQEIELFVGDDKIGEAEVNLKDNMLSRLSIYPPYQDKGYGTHIVDILNKKYCCDCLWVRADNERAIHVYEKNGYKIDKATMFMMIRDNKSAL